MNEEITREEFDNIIKKIIDMGYGCTWKEIYRDNSGAIMFDNFAIIKLIKPTSKFSKEGIKKLRYIEWKIKEKNYIT